MLHILLRVLHLLGEDSSYVYPVVDGEGPSIKVEANSIHIPNHQGENDCKLGIRNHIAVIHSIHHVSKGEVHHKMFIILFKHILRLKKILQNILKDLKDFYIRMDMLVITN